MAPPRGRGLRFTTCLEACRTGADVAAGSPVGVAIANDERPFGAVLAHGTPGAEVWSEGPPDAAGGIVVRYREAEGKRSLAGR